MLNGAERGHARGLASQRSCIWYAPSFIYPHHLPHMPSSLSRPFTSLQSERFMPELATSSCSVSSLLLSALELAAEGGDSPQHFMSMCP